MALPLKRVRSQQGLDATERLRVVIERLPEAVEARDKFGHTSFRVRDKPFVIVGDGNGEGSLAIKSEPETQAFLIEHRPFTRTRYIGQHGWVSVERLPPEDWAEVEDLVVDAYLLAAPNSLARRVRVTDD